MIVISDLLDFVQSRDECQKAVAIFKYEAEMRQPAKSLLDILSLDFSGPFKKTKKWNPFLLIEFENLSDWPVVRAALTETCEELLGSVNLIDWPVVRVPLTETCEEVLGFVQTEILSVFGTHRFIVTEHVPAFKMTAFR